MAMVLSILGALDDLKMKARDCDKTTIARV